MRKFIKNFRKAPKSTVAGLVTGLAVPLIELWATGSLSKESVIMAVAIFLTGGGTDLAKEKKKADDNN